MGEDFETVIGLECHVELSTRTKMFCGSPNEFGAPPNTNVCPICLGLPGSLPVPNEQAIEYIVRIGLALDCEIARYSLFHRKNYFYPDMPKNFQISQYDLPICVKGHLDVQVDGVTDRVGITRVHMEEDTGKTTHAGASGRIAQAEYALIDYNRAGVPLVEVVSEPDIRSPEGARAYFNELRATLEALDVSDVRMEEGSLRCDANISVRPIGSSEYGTKVEIKNLNSVRSLERALKYEQERQVAALRAGQPLVQETRHFDEGDGTTHTLRSKEEAFDYRYFPEPDLPPLEPDTEWVDRIRGSLPELPAARRARFERGLGLAPKQAALVGASKATADFLEEAVGLGAPAAAVANWMTQDLSGLLNKARIELAESKVTPQHIADLIRLVEAATISITAAKQVLEEAFETGKPVEEIVETRGLRQVTDTSALEAWVVEAIAENPGPVEQFRAGKDGAINFLVGQVMRKSRGAANVQAVQELLRAMLSGS
ncbi:MAG TPA: Asp-tRNA(Asn)/Glu-tRNA(Gln) amidotransferase subunit GatB [Actinomycetota bacterium]|nr:Asp-tRNA(Asn)/Glu-tRNA(Gln) amidotransferase subunit GatB [Actinomycetota bacterium]